MAIINQAAKELQVKVVYYGPALCGKTTNLIKVHENVQTAQERASWFPWPPARIGRYSSIFCPSRHVDQRL